MRNTGNLKVTTPTDREIVMTRVFAAPRCLVFDALTKPELVKQWLLGPPGWTMPICGSAGLIALCGAARMELRWGREASTAKSCPPSDSSQPKISMNPGTRARRW